MSSTNNDKALILLLLFIVFELLIRIIEVISTLHFNFQLHYLWTTMIICGEVLTSLTILNYSIYKSTPMILSEYLQFDPIEHLTIESLPNELMDSIFENLNQLDLIRFGQTCKQLHEMVKTRLWASIYVNNGGTKIKVSNHCHTAFYLRFTIMPYYKFVRVLPENLQHIKKITFFSDDIDDELKSLLELNQVARAFETSKDKSFDLIYNTKMANARTLFRNMNRVHLIVKTLNFTKLTNETIIDWDLLIQVRSLSINFEDKLVDLNKIQDVIDLKNIKSLTLCFSGKPNETKLSDFVSQCKGLNHLAIISKNIEFSKVIHRLKPNTLKSFYVNVSGRFDCFSALIVNEILKFQKTSLENLCWSNIKINSNLKMHGLSEFERFYERNTLLKDQDIAEIKTLLSNGFANLSNVISNDTHYTINQRSIRLGP